MAAFAKPSPHGLLFPNGIVLTPDGATLIVAETFGERLTAFAVAPGGALSQPREFARVPGAMPDGICLDAEGCVWVASATGAPGQLLRVCEGGEVVARVETSRPVYACMLGGDDGRNLFVCTSSSAVPDVCRSEPDACIEVVRVDVPRAGLP